MNEDLELGIHRALCDEVPPSVRRIFASLSGECITLRIVHVGGIFDWALFEEVVESEFEQVAPRASLKSVRTIRVVPEQRLGALSEEFDQEPGEQLIWSNPWAVPFSETSLPESSNT